MLSCAGAALISLASCSSPRHGHYLPSIQACNPVTITEVQAAETRLTSQYPVSEQLGIRLIGIKGKVARLEVIRSKRIMDVEEGGYLTSREFGMRGLRVVRVLEEEDAVIVVRRGGLVE